MLLMWWNSHLVDHLSHHELQYSADRIQGWLNLAALPGAEKVNFRRCNKECNNLRLFDTFCDEMLMSENRSMHSHHPSV